MVTLYVDWSAWPPFLHGVKFRWDLQKVFKTTADFFPRCSLQPAHLLLALRLGMIAAFKLRNFITAAGFARRLLELPDTASEKNADTRSKVWRVCGGWGGGGGCVL